MEIFRENCIYLWKNKKNNCKGDTPLSLVFLILFNLYIFFATKQPAFYRIFRIEIISVTHGEQRRFETDLKMWSDKRKILDDYVQDKNILHDQNRRAHTPFKSSMRNHGKWWPNWTATLSIIQELNPSQYEIKVFPFWNNAMNDGTDIILLHTQRNKLTKHTREMI